MDKKRFFYLLAFLVIIAVIIVPAVISSNHGGSEPGAETAAPGIGSGNSQAAEAGSGETEVTEETPAEQASSNGNQGEPSSPSNTVPAAASPAQNPTERPGCRVGIAVVGIGGEMLYPPVSVSVNPGNRWGITALGALDATGLPYAMKPRWPNFVDSISGQACKGVSGWMYMVNGEIPMHLADKHPVKEGDKVIWWYSESMDQEPPVWDKLKK